MVHFCYVCVDIKRRRKHLEHAVIQVGKLFQIISSRSEKGAKRSAGAGVE